MPSPVLPTPNEADAPSAAIPPGVPTLPNDPRITSRPRWNTREVQYWYDPWRSRVRVLEFKGRCASCGRRTYAFTDGENDPRGILGDRAAQPLTASDYGMTGPDVPACFPCMNEEAPYVATLAYARRAAWTEGVRP